MKSRREGSKARASVLARKRRKRRMVIDVPASLAEIVRDALRLLAPPAPAKANGSARPG
jgi:hypothetical protein